MRQVLVTLSHGFVIGGVRYRHASLRELNGHDEQFLDGIKNEMPVFLQSMELIKRVASFENTSENDEVFKNLTVGDRILLFLNVRRLTFGNLLQCVTSCPSCLQKISIDINIDDLPGSKNPSNLDSEYSLDVERFQIKIRPMNTSDQKSTLLLSGKKSSELIEHLVRQCIVSSTPVLPSGSIPEPVVSAISSKLEEMDPLAETELELACPSCQNKFQRQFDIEKFILDEINLRRHDLEHEIHKIAFYYHWDEDTILSLPMKKRQRYVELIDNTLSGNAR